MLEVVRRLELCFKLAWKAWEAGATPEARAENMEILLKGIAKAAVTGDGKGSYEWARKHDGSFRPPKPDNPDRPSDIEDLAAIHHLSWAGWTRYMLKRIEEDIKASIPNARHVECLTDTMAVRAFRELPSVQRWTRQMNTLYEDLPEEEKESDRKEVAKHIGHYRPWYFNEQAMIVKNFKAMNDAGFELNNGCEP